MLVPLLSRVILGSYKMYRIRTRNFAWVLAFSPFVFAFCAKAGERRRKRDKRREFGGGGGGPGREGRREKTKWGQIGQKEIQKERERQGGREEERKRNGGRLARISLLFPMLDGHACHSNKSCCSTQSLQVTKELVPQRRVL